MILSLRGANGSGKSYLVKQLLDKFSATPESKDAKGRPLNYVVTANGQSLYVVGNYEKACGGCDGIQPYTEIWPRVDRLAGLGHVIFEGMVVSSSYGTIGRASEKYGDNFIFVFLDTPLGMCIENVNKRRHARGNDKPFDPRNVVRKFECVERSIKAITAFHRRVVILDHNNSMSQLLGLLGWSINDTTNGTSTRTVKPRPRPLNRPKKGSIHSLLES